jgi:hypothetical protein
MHTAYTTTATPQQQVVLLVVCRKPLLLMVVHLLLPATTGTSTGLSYRQAQCRQAPLLWCHVAALLPWQKAQHWSG